MHSREVVLEDPFNQHAAGRACELRQLLHREAGLAASSAGRQHATPGRALQTYESTLRSDADSFASA
jgi:hypothetical protein